MVRLLGREKVTFHSARLVWQSVKEPLQEVHFLFLDAPEVLAFAAPSAELLVNPYSL